MKYIITSALHWRGLLAAITLFLCGAASAAPAGLDFSGTLENGATFSGFVLWGDFDIEGGSPGSPGSLTDDVGRFVGGLWHVDVTAGSTTEAAVLDKSLGGRAPVETREVPPLINILVLGSDAGEVPRLSLMFEPVAGYDADLRPSFTDILGFYSSISAGGKTVFSGFTDANNVFSKVASIEFADGTYRLTAVPLPGGFALMAGALAMLPGVRRVRRVARA